MSETTNFCEDHFTTESNKQNYAQMVAEIGWPLLRLVIAIVVIRTVYVEWQLRCQTRELVYYVFYLLLAMTTVSSWRSELFSEIYHGAITYSSSMKKLIVLWLLYLTINILTDAIWVRLRLIKALPDTATSHGGGHGGIAPSLSPLLLSAFVVTLKLVARLQETIERVD
ncbi:hypothetical protein AMS68_002346 [Peltaster fructicola]|uniref:Uncharacterized protein n=1 Tax=Peltaster fructicola TaxID=286661 RepID=A0A6H0XQD8_9PEZI|nr:hypothetical protein AMS68_002346 [Peltaster fructicola]